MDADGSNAYSPEWFAFFHVDIPEARTTQETDFIRRVCPQPDFRRVLDVCCGMGRHARALAACGYEVMGVERNVSAVAAARARGGGPVYTCADVREYLPAPGAFDAAVVMSQSFGFFDAEANRSVLVRLGSALRLGGRIVLDLWNPEFFATRQGRRSFETPAGTVQETKRMDGDRLLTRLDYPNGARDDFEWQTFSPAQMARFAETAGLKLIVACTDFDATVAPSADKPRVQYLLKRG